MSHGFQADMRMRRSFGFVLSVSIICTRAGLGVSIAIYIYIHMHARAHTHDLYLSELVDALAGVVCMAIGVRGAEVPPLEAVHRPEVALLT